MTKTKNSTICIFLITFFYTGVSPALEVDLVEHSRNVQKNQTMSINKLEAERKQLTIDLERKISESGRIETGAITSINKKPIDPVKVRINKNGIKIKKTTFRWGSKPSGYEYFDETITVKFDNPKAMILYSNHFLLRTEEGWGIGLNRNSASPTDMKHEIRWRRSR